MHYSKSQPLECKLTPPSDVQARPPALVYWNSDPKLELEEEQGVTPTGLTFTTTSKVVVVLLVLVVLVLVLLVLVLVLVVVVVLLLLLVVVVLVLLVHHGAALPGQVSFKATRELTSLTCFASNKVNWAKYNKEKSP